MADKYVSFNGYEYDPRILGAPLETIRLRERLNEARSINAGTLALGLAVESFERILADRAAGSHVLARRADDDQICVCGLVVAPGADLKTTPGHLDQERWTAADNTTGTKASSGSYSDEAPAADDE